MVSRDFSAVQRTEISLLGKDLTALNRLFNQGQRTELQDKLYPLPPDARQRIGQSSWGNCEYTDQRGRTWKPLEIPDIVNAGKFIPVSDVSPDTGVTFFSYSAIHSFPSWRTLAFAACFFDLSIPTWALFHLKGCWEAWMGKQVGFTNNVGSNLGELLTDPMNLERSCHSGEFRLDHDQLRSAMNILRRHHRSSGPDMRFDDLADLLREMSLARLYLKPVFGSHVKDRDVGKRWDQSDWSPELWSFVERWDTRRKTIESGSDEEKQEFFSYRLQWIELSEAVTDLGYEIEVLRQKAWNIKNEWDRLFGPSYLAFLVATNRLHYAETRLSLIELEGDDLLTPERLEEMIRKIEEADETLGEIERYTRDVQLADSLEKDESGTGAANPDDIVEYERKVREVIREILFLSHEDRWNQQKNFEKLLQKQKDEIKEYFERAVEIKNNDVGYQRGQVGWDHPSYAFLCRVRDRILDIFSTAGVEIDLSLVLPGFEKIADQIFWFEREIPILESEKVSAQVKLDELCESAEKREVARWKAEIDDPECHSQVRDYYDRLAREAIEKAEPLEMCIEDWLKKFSSIVDSGIVGNAGLDRPHPPGEAGR